jgi:hypothetical protein
MKQILIVGHGGPDKLQLRGSPDPRPASGEIRIRVKASASILPTSLRAITTLVSASASYLMRITEGKLVMLSTRNCRNTSACWHDADRPRHDIPSRHQFSRAGRTSASPHSRWSVSTLTSQRLNARRAPSSFPFHAPFSP